MQAESTTLNTSPGREGASADTLLAEGCARLGVGLDTAQRERLAQFAQLLLKWRRVYNLVGVKTLHEVISHHLLDSLSVAGAIVAGRLLDVGTGAGLPGLPLAIARPAIRAVLLEANAKRVRFLEHAVQTLQIENVEVVRERAENYNPRQRFDYVISRALCGWPQFVALAEPLLNDTGQILAMKGRFEGQSQALHSGVKIVEVRALNVPGIPGRRCLVRGVRAA